MNSQNNSFLSHILKIGAGTIVTLFIGLLTTPILTRIVEPESYGQLSMFQLYTNISVMVLCLGLDQSLVRFFYEADNFTYHSRLVRFCTVIPIIASFVCILLFLAVIIVFSLKLEFDSFILILLAFNIIIALTNRFALLVLRITYQSGLYSICNIIYRVSNVLTVVLLVKLTTVNDVYGLCIGVLLGYTLSTFLALFKERSLWFSKRIKSLNNQKEINNKELFKYKEILRYGLPFILSMGITQLFEALDKLSLNHFCSYSDVGIYTSAMSIINIFAVIQTAFNAVWGPRQVEEYVSHPDDTSFIQFGNQIITVIMFSLGLSLIFSKDIFAIILGEKFRRASVILPFLVFNPIMYTVSETTCSGIGISKKSYLNVIIALGACITNFIGNMILVPLIGPRGAAISTGISYFVFWALRTFFSNKWYYIDYRLPKFFTITFVAFVYAFYNTFYSNITISILGYVGSMGILLLLYKDSIKKGIKLILDKKKAKNKENFV